MGTQITRKVEFDAGHRIPAHGSKCAGNHGHRYVVKATIFGPVQPVRGESDDGMVIDFQTLKDLMNKHVVDEWDHATLAWKDDHQYIAGLLQMSRTRIIMLDLIPTAENLAVIIYRKLHDAIRALDKSGKYGVERVRVYETPNCYADCLTLGG